MSVPVDVPVSKRMLYKKNLRKATKGTGRLMLFAGDQRVEHLHGDFYGKGIDTSDANPEHFFRIASKARIGCFATQLGFVARYGKEYRNIPYLIKLNSKTNLVPTKHKDPLSTAWYSVADVVQLKRQSKLNIVGVGYTIYLGSVYESIMLEEAAQIVKDAHKAGLFTVLWIYPRGKAVKKEKTQEILAGATSVGAALNTDFVKINPPEVRGKRDPKLLQRCVDAAGRTKVVCAGGSQKSVKAFLQELHDQIHTGRTSGNATGRNIHQKSLKEAIAMCNAVSAITFDNATVAEAMKAFRSS